MEKQLSGMTFFNSLLYCVGALFAIFFAGHFFLKKPPLGHFPVSDRIQNIRQEMKRVEKTKQADTDFQLIAAGYRQKKLPALILRELENITPPTLFLSEVKWQKAIVRIRGEAQSDLDLALFLDRLQQSTVLIHPALLSLNHENNLCRFELRMSVPDHEPIATGTESTWDALQKKLIKYADRDRLLEEMIAMGERHHVQVKLRDAGPVVSENNYWHQSFRMELTGNSAEVSAHIQQISNLPWMVVMKNFDLGHSLSDVEFSIYYLKNMTHDAQHTIR